MGSRLREQRDAVSAAQDAVLAAVDVDEITDLERASVRIPSDSFQEGAYADYLAEQMRASGLEVTMLEFSDPFAPARVSRQPLGRLGGRTGDPVLMFDGHMDHNAVIGTWDRDPFSGDLEDGWIHGRGAMDDKGGIVAALVAVRALRRSGVTLDGDILLAPVGGHKNDGIGSRLHLERGTKITYCINTENTGNEIITACVGVVKMRISTYNQPIHFHAIDALRERFFNPIEQLALVITALGPSHATPDWLRYESCPELATFPQSGFTDIRSDYRKDGWCHVDFQVRTVPGMSKETVLRDVNAVLAGLKTRYPKLAVKVEPVGLETPPMVMPRADPVVLALERSYRRATGESPAIGARGRLGSIGDGQLFAAAGIPSVLFGPGTSEIFDQWPTPNEKIRVADIVASAKTMALAALQLCGARGSEDEGGQGK